MTYGVLCRGLLSGRMTRATEFHGDDIRKKDPKFREPRFSQYLEAVGRLDKLAREMFGKTVLALAVRWVLDQGSDIAIWGARRPEQLNPLPETMGWKLDEAIVRDMDDIIQETVKSPAGPEFRAPPDRSHVRMA